MKLMDLLINYIDLKVEAEGIKVVLGPDAVGENITNELKRMEDELRRANVVYGIEGPK